MFWAEKSLTDSQMMHKYPTTKAGREFWIGSVDEATATGHPCSLLTHENI